MAESGKAKSHTYRWILKISMTVQRSGTTTSYVLSLNKNDHFIQFRGHQGLKV